MRFGFRGFFAAAAAVLGGRILDFRPRDQSFPFEQPFPAVPRNSKAGAKMPNERGSNLRLHLGPRRPEPGAQPAPLRTHPAAQMALGVSNALQGRKQLGHPGFINAALTKVAADGRSQRVGMAQQAVVQTLQPRPTTGQVGVGLLLPGSPTGGQGGRQLGRIAK